MPSRTVGQPASSVTAAMLSVLGKARGQPEGVAQLTWQHQARLLKREVYALYFAIRDPRVPWYAKALAGCVVAYAFSPIDLIPDPIPVLGYLDDLVLIPLGVLAVRRMVPDQVMTECRVKAQALIEKPANWIAAAVIVLIWLALGAVSAYWLVRAFSN